MISAARPMRSIMSLMMLMLAASSLHAGQPMYVLVPDEGSPTTTADDKARMVQLRWYEGAEPRFYVIEQEYGYGMNGEWMPIMVEAVNQDNQLRPALRKVDVMEAINRALQTWNGARWGTMKFFPSVMGSSSFLTITGPDFISYRISDIPDPRVDGFNIITFMAEQVTVDGDLASMTMISYFRRDWSPDDLEIIGNRGLESNIRYIDIISDNDQVAQWLQVDLDLDGNFELFLPARDWKAGEIFDTDIVVSDEAIPYLHTWPASEGDIPSSLRDQVLGSLDVQALFTYEFGKARGLADSMLVEASMFPAFIGGTTQNAPALENPYRRRILSFDDEVAVGLADGSDFEGLASIAGQVIEGSVVDGAVDGAITDVIDEVVVMAPVYLLVRPEVQENSSHLNNGRPVSPLGSSPDDIVASPIAIPGMPLPTTAGVWRKIVQVLSGQDLVIAAGPGTDFFTDLPDANNDNVDDGIDPDGQPGDRGITFPDDEEEALVLSGTLNSVFYFPGLPATDDLGEPIEYAVRLENPELDIVPHPAYQIISEEAGEDYVDEFYGGPLSQLQVGNGLAQMTDSINDQYFGNGYIYLMLNPYGRFAGAITGGPNFLSGMYSDPRSFIEVTSGNRRYSNRVAAIGQTRQGLVIDDVNKAGSASWIRGGDFTIDLQMGITENGGIVGIPHGVRVTYTLRNIGDNAQTFKLRQVLDTFLLGSENPAYTVNGLPVRNAVTYVGSNVPARINYQTSISDPSFTAFLDLRGFGVTVPEKVTIAGMNDLLAGRTFTSGKGYGIGGFSRAVSDTGIALEWPEVTLLPQEGRSYSFIIGFLEAGSTKDGWVNLDPDTITTIEDLQNLTGVEDDPDLIEPIVLEHGEQRDGIIIITNTGEADDGIGNENQEAGAMVFRLIEDAFPDTRFFQAAGALSDVDLDGDLDVIVAGVPRSGDDPVASGYNRLYENRQRINPDGSISYYFVDVTFGPDGIPNTEDDRLPGPSEYTVGVVVGDFDMDGDEDILFLNRNAPNRFYINVGFPGHYDIAGKFEDVTHAWMPGALNRARYLPDGHNNPLSWDYPSRAVVGDIDSDGDLDIIISQLQPLTDEVYHEDGSQLVPPSRAYLEIGPRTQAMPNGDNRPNSSEDYWSGDLQLAERVLINMTIVPPYDDRFQGGYFIDDSLGRDMRFGVMTNFLDQGTSYNRVIPYEILSGEPDLLRGIAQAIDRMPPSFPATAILNPRTTDSLNVVVNSVETPMTPFAIQPILAPFFADTSLDLFSIRMSQGSTSGNAGATTIPLSFELEDDDFVNEEGTTQVSFNVQYSATDPALFRNLDIWDASPTADFSGLGTDGIQDGYFQLINYNFDFCSINGDIGLLPHGLYPGAEATADSMTVESRGGLFVHQINEWAPDLVVKDVIPLFLGVPESHPGNADVNPADNDLIPSPGGIIGMTGLVADWFNNGAPRPMLLPYNAVEGAGVGGTTSGPILYSGDFFTGGRRYLREEGSFGDASQFYSVDVLSPMTSWAGSTAWAANELTPAGGGEGGEDEEGATIGAPMVAVAGDFDRDGDPDMFYAATNSDVTILNENYEPVFEMVHASNVLWANDSFGNLVDVSTNLIPNPPGISLYALTGDVDNDGDLDLIILSGNGPNKFYRNDAFTRPPDLGRATDRPMFYEASAEMVPPWSGIADGHSIRGSVGDLDGDGRPDLGIARGGVFTPSTAASMIYFNRGDHRLAPGTYVFQPAGSVYPAPYLTNLAEVDEGGIITKLIMEDGNGNGVLNVNHLDFFRDIVFGDIDNDGDLDILTISTALYDDPDKVNESLLVETGPQIYVNMDVDDFTFNTMPDDDDIGDGIFLHAPTAIPPLEDRQNVYLDAVTLKKQGRRARMADVNHDGLLDIIIANGFDGGGAPNVLLLNRPEMPGMFRDVTDGPHHFLPVMDHPSQPGIMDNTADLAVADFDHDGNMEIIFINRSNPGSPWGFRFLDALHEPGVPAEGVFVDSDGHFIDTEGQVTTYEGTRPHSVVVADFDGIGEWTEDVNYNGVLDPGEDLNGNGIIDWIDLPSETEDLNGNGILDEGEDVGIIGADGELIGAGNGVIDQYDRNNDGIFTARRDGVWEGSLDLFVTFEDGHDRILINDPTNINPGYFRDQTLLLFPNLGLPTDSRGVDVGDIDNDGDPDIIVAVYRGGVVSPVRLWLNQTIVLPDGKVRRGVFDDYTHEVPPARAFRFDTDTTAGENPQSFNPWANDVKLIDIDGDGDLDFITLGLGRLDRFTPASAVELTYINRLVSEGFQHLTRRNEEIVVYNPTVIGVAPNGSARGMLRQVTVKGLNFDKDVQFSFGEGIDVLEVINVNPHGNQAEVMIYVHENAQLGPRRVVVQNGRAGGATMTKPGAFTVYETLADANRNNVREDNWTLYE